MMLKSKKQNNVGVLLTLKNKDFPYPSDMDVRLQYFGNPLTDIFGEYYENVAIQYYKDETGENLTEIDVMCFNPKFKIKKEDDEKSVLAIAISTFFKYLEGSDIEILREQIYRIDKEMKEHFVGLAKEQRR